MYEKYHRNMAFVILIGMPYLFAIMFLCQVTIESIPEQIGKCSLAGASGTMTWSVINI